MSTKTKASKKPVKKTTKGPDATCVPTRPLEVLARKNLDGTVAIMRLDNDEYFYTLNGIAAEAWALIDGKTELGEIQRKLIEKFNPPMSRFQKDMAKLIADLKKEKLLTV